MMRKVERGSVATDMEGGYEALQSMLKGEYTEESTGARTIRQTGGKDRHSKVFTSKGPRDRRVRLSVATAIRFYDLQDRLGFEQPSKAVEWLLLHCQPSIQALPQLAALHPVRVAAIPQPVMYIHHPSPHNNHQEEQKSCQDHITHHQYKGKEPHHDQTVHYFRGHQSHHHDHNYTLDSVASYDTHVQDSIEEDLPESSNHSSSGASSDHPLQLSDVAWPDCKALAVEVVPGKPNHTDSSGLRRCSSSSSPIFYHMNKRNRVQNPAFSSPHHHIQTDDYATFTSNSNITVDTGAPSALNHHSNCSLATEKIFGMNSDMAPANCSSNFNNNNNLTSLLINDYNAFIAANNSLQGQVNVAMQPMMRSLASSAEPNQYMDVTQSLLAAQAANQLTNDGLIIQQDVMQSVCNNYLMNRGGAGGSCTCSNLNDTIIQLYNKIGPQQVEELVSTMYASPSPSESTSMAAAYSKAESNIRAHDQAADNLYNRPSWSTLPATLARH